MVKIDVEENEAKAYVELLKDAKMPPEMGYTLTMLKYKIFTAFKKDGDAKNKLFVQKNCLNYIKEVQAYRYDKKMLEEEVEVKKSKGKDKK